MKNNTTKEIWKKINESNNILLSLHYGPDGDSLGSCTAMKYLLENQLNKKVRLISKDSLDETLNSIRFSKEVIFGEEISDQNLESFDLILALDSGTINQITGRDKPFSKPAKLQIINIDHHATNDFFGDLNYVNSNKASACSVLLEIFKEMNVTFDSELATRLLLGIYTDSGYFSHDNGNSLKDAAFLIDFKVDYLNEIVNKIKYNQPLKIKKYYAHLYSKFKITEMNNLKIGHSSTSLEEIKKLGLNLSEVRGGINELQEVGGLDIIFTLAEMENSIKGSFRSRKTDISDIAKTLGGGGHKGAAAFKLEKMPLEEAEKKVFEAINTKFNASPQQSNI